MYAKCIYYIVKFDIIKGWLIDFRDWSKIEACERNDLAHGELGNWLKNINLDRTQAHRFIKVSEEIKDVGTYQHLGLSFIGNS